MALPFLVPFTLGGSAPVVAFANMGFEIEEVTAPGYPAVWLVVLNGTAEEIAAFDDGTLPLIVPSLPFETFEGAWSNNQAYVFEFEDPIDLGVLEKAIFDTALPDFESVEDFEEGWSNNHLYLFDLASIESAVFDVGTPQVVEDFEEEWSANEDYVTTWDEVQAGAGDEAAIFDGEAFEDFEEQWDGNEDYAFDWTGIVGSSAASFDAGTGGTPESVEDFEETKAVAAYTVTVGTDTINAASHGLSNGMRVTFHNDDGRTPDGISEGYRYFIIGATGGTFQIAPTSGGGAVDITDTGIGTQFYRADPEVYWTLFMVTL